MGNDEDDNKQCVSGNTVVFFSENWSWSHEAEDLWAHESLSQYFSSVSLFISSQADDDDDDDEEEEEPPLSPEPQPVKVLLAGFAAWCIQLLTVKSAGSDLWKKKVTFLLVFFLIFSL